MSYFNDDVKAVEARVRRADISEANKESILGFSRFLSSQGLSRLRVMKYLNHLKVLAEMLGCDFEEVLNQNDRAKMEWLVSQIGGSVWAEPTKQDYRVVLKRLYRWLNGGRDPELTVWINTGMKKSEGKLPEDLLTEDEVKRLIDAAGNSRDKAFIALLWDSGMRVGELGGLKVKSLVFDNYGGVAVLKGKTGPRRVRLVWSISYLVNWLEEHPLRNNPNAPLWVGLGYRNDLEAMNYHAIRMRIKRIAAKAGVKKKIHPHLFRHSRATHMANHLTEAQMNAYFGWVQGSDMPSIYVHLSGRDVDDAVLRMHGLKKDEEKAAGTVMKICPRCRLPNPEGVEICRRCTMILDEKKAREIEEAQNRLAEVTEVGLKDGLINLLGTSDIRALLTREDVKKIMREAMTEELKGEARRLLKEGALKI